MTKRNEFVASIRKKILQVTGIPQSNLSTLVERESTKSLADLQLLLKPLENDESLMDADSLKPFIEFLRARFDRIHGTDGFYTLKTNSPTESAANHVCVYLANCLNAIDNTIKWPGKTAAEMLMPANRSMIERNETLRRYTFSECKSVNDILNELVQFPLTEWQSCLKEVNSGTLKTAFFAKEMPKNAEEMKDITKLFGDDLVRNRAILCCLFQIYINDREAKPGKRSIFGLYNKAQKIAAAQSLQDYLLQERNMVDFHDSLKTLTGLKEHAGALEDGTLKLFKDEILACALLQLKTVNEPVARAAACS